MTDDEAKHFLTRAKYVAKKYGYYQLADDFAQEVLLAFIENPNRKSTVDQLFIDYLRSTYGRPGTPGYEQRYALACPISLDIQSEDHPSLYDVIGSAESDSRSEQSTWECSRLFEGREAMIYALYFIEQMTESEIGSTLGITESRVSQILKNMKKEIRSYFTMKEMKERLEWDASFGVYQVEWIQI